MSHEPRDDNEKPTGEKYYDEHIAPKLRALSQECRDNGLSLLAACEWEPGEYGSTYSPQPETGIGLKIIKAAVQANGNVDALIMAIMKHARVHGHGSMILHQLGVPTEPPKQDEETTIPKAS